MGSLHDIRPLTDQQAVLGEPAKDQERCLHIMKSLKN